MGGANAPKYVPAVVRPALSVVPTRNRAVPRYVGTGRSIRDTGVAIDDGDGLHVPGLISTGDLATTGFALPNVDGAAGQVLTTDGGGAVSWQPGGAGDVVGPAGPVVDGQAALFDGISGKLLKASAFTLPAADGAAGQVLTTNGAGATSWQTNANGDVVGPAGPVVDGQAALFDGISGKLVKASAFTLPAADGAAGQVLTTDGAGATSWQTDAGGDVVGPAGATDEAIARFDLTTGKLLKNSPITISNAGVLTVNPGSGFALPAVDGAAFQFLQTNGAGTASWQTSNPTSAILYSGAGPFQYEVPAFINNGVQTVGDTDVRIAAGTIYPATATQDLGTAANEFRDLYLSGSGNANSFYETGTFTPVLSCAVPGTLSVSYAGGRFGEFLRLGRMVFVNLYFQIATISLGTASGEAFITGFPYAPANDSMVSSIFQIINVSNATISVSGVVRGGLTRSSVALLIDNGSIQYIQISELTINDLIRQTGCYMIP